MARFPSITRSWSSGSRWSSTPQEPTVLQHDQQPRSQDVKSRFGFAPETPEDLQNTDRPEPVYESRWSESTHSHVDLGEPSYIGVLDDYWEPPSKRVSQRLSATLRKGFPVRQDLTALLCDAAASGDVQMIGRILGAGGDYTKKNADGLLPIHLAAMAGQLEAIKSLVHSGADINAKDASGLTPLHHAAQLATSSVSRAPSALSSRRASAASRYSTLRFSYVFGGPAEKSHSRKPSRTSVRSSASTTSSSSASDERSCSLVEALLRCGARSEVRDRQGNSPLHLAVLAGSVQSVTALLEQGANIHARNKAGLTPLGVLAASEEANETLSRFLLDRGAVEMPFEEKGHSWFKKASL